MKRTALLLSMALGVTLPALHAADWAAYLGPNGTNRIEAEGIATSWPEGGPKVVWTTALGAGFAGPAVYDGKVYILDRPNDEKDALRCLDLATGNEEWRYEYDAAGKFSFNGSRTTPAVDDKAVYTVGPLGDVHCISKETHQPIWKKHILNDFDARKPHWVIAQSPLLYGDTVIVAPQGSKGTVVALNKANGEIVWSSPAFSTSLSYASPVLTNLGGIDQIVILSGAKEGTVVGGVNAKTGEVLWKYTGWQCNIPITSPTFIGDGRVFITGEYGAGSAMIRVTKDGDTFKVEELYKIADVESQIHQPILYGDHLYLQCNGNSRKDGFACIDLDGTVKWKTGGNPNYERGPLLMVNDLLIGLDGDKGELALMKPSPEKLEVISKVALFGNGKQAWAPMALVDGMLLVRNQSEIKCVDIRAN